jgi:hypothetical protein
MDDVRKSTWYANMLSRELQEARDATKKTKTYENLVNVQRLCRELEKEVRDNRRMFRVVAGEQDDGEPRV